MQLYAEINKVDEVQRMVYGYASTEALDSQGEVVKREAVKGAWDEYMHYANVREMHQPHAAGVVKEYAFDEKGVMIGAKVIDDHAWKKVTEHVYKGFSIGGCALERQTEKRGDQEIPTITKLRLTEISLVDRPANPDAVITLYKADAPASIATTVSPPAVTTPPVNTMTTTPTPHAVTNTELVTKLNEVIHTLSGLLKANESLMKRIAELEAQPAPAKGVLRAISKAEDAAMNDHVADTLPANATPEQRAKHDIQKIHRQGGTPFMRF